MDGFKTLCTNDRVDFKYDERQKRAIHVIKRK